MTTKHISYLAVASALLCSGPLVQANSIPSTLLLDQQGLVLMVDGKDRDLQVRLDVRVRTYSAGLDFGFMSNGSFSSLAGDCCRKAGAVFAGGTTIDFAVRSQGADNRFGTADDQLFRLSDSAHYADQYYSGRIKPSKSRNPEVLDPYYSSLAMIWDLDHDGIKDLKVTLNSRNSFDGMQLVPASVPVPLPAAAWLFGSGLVGLAALARRRRVRI